MNSMNLEDPNHAQSNAIEISNFVFVILNNAKEKKKEDTEKK
jgi:hypothetical protein